MDLSSSQADIAPRSAVEKASATSEFFSQDQLLEELSSLVHDYLEKRPHLSLMALSQRCDVSEPTLRRLKGKNFKSLPTAGTVVKFLSYITQETEVEKIIEKHPGAISEFLQTQFPDSDKYKRRFDNELHEVFESDTHYLVYKLCCQPLGVPSPRIQRVFGAYGQSALHDLQRAGFVEKRDSRYFACSDRWFSLPPERLPMAMKTILNFVKHQTSPQDPLLTPIQANYSTGVNANAYREVTRLQKECLQNIRKVLGSKQSHGEIPLFLVLAIDTLDSKLPEEDFNGEKA